MDSEHFYQSLKKHSDFHDLSDPENYTSLPDDWMIGCADIVGSTQAIEEGRYKTVNMVGAAVISAQVNSHGDKPFPYVFGGDGAAFACRPDQAELARETLAAVQCWANEEFDLALRTACVPVKTVREAGLDVTVARYSASDDVDYAMFGGGGISWVERQMKAGKFSVVPAAPGTQPDLTGLSCRWSPVKAQNGTILSLVVEPTASPPGADFARVAEAVIGIANNLNRGGHPIPPAGAQVNWPTGGVTLEARASRGEQSVFRRKLVLMVNTLFAWFLFKTNMPIGKFRPEHYRRAVGRNADFRKFDDGLKMTLDCDEKTLKSLEQTLKQAKSDGIIEYGLSQQSEAMMTCFVPSAMQDDHVHFIDGAAGGYALAAAQIKSSRA